MRTLWCFLLLMTFFFSCEKKSNPFPFIPLESTKSKILFSNDLTDSDSFNIMQYLYFYNGGGVAAGDVNNDGKVDLFFTGNQVTDALYLNNGDLTFQDISEKSGINLSNGWSTGVTMLDINADGWLDIYVCRLGNFKIYTDHNRLYINNQNGTFTESSKEYGLDFSGFSTQAAFFDYDNDGDLDCYLLNHSVKRPDQFVAAKNIRFEHDSLSGDRLYQNQDGKYIDITQSSGIYSSNVGFGLSVSIADLNNDFWPDIYVGNDFHENDYLYLNNQDGTFVEVIQEAVGHTSNFTMGSTVGDLNKDMEWDIFSLDMLPNQEKVFKESGGWESKQIYDFKRSYGYHHQSPKNALQIKLGQKGAIPQYSEQASLFNIHASDWSWTPLIADFDLDSNQDIYITNGIYKRPNNMDFVNYYSDPENESKSDLEMIQLMPNGIVANQYYSNDEGQFIELQAGEPSISNGACTADLDNDGDLDIIVNNLNSPASILLNQTDPTQYIQLQFRGKSTKNNLKNGIKVILKNDANENLNSILHTGNKGFQSMDQSILSIPKSAGVTKGVVHWVNGQTTEFDVNSETQVVILEDSMIKGSQLQQKEKISPQVDRIYTHKENVYNDQNKEPLLLYGLSQNGPKITINNEGKIFIPQGKGENGVVYDLNSESPFTFINKGSDTRYVDETAAVFFDADGDGDEDLYVCLGGNELPDGDLSLPDILFINTEGKFELNTKMLPKIPKNTSTVSAADYDNDGDIDLFVGVQSRAGDYGNPDASYLLKNLNNRRFQAFLLDIKEVVFDSDWKDIDQDGRMDIVVAGHWMPITILFNKPEGFQKYEIPNSQGWWYSLKIEDFDNDGFLDILAGNFGKNHRLDVGLNSPLKMYVKDFDNNRQNDPIISYTIDGIEYPYPNLDLLLKQIPSKRKEFILHADYAEKSISELFSKAELDGSKIKTATTLNSTVYFQNAFDEWVPKELPTPLQAGPIWAIEFHQGNYLLGGNHYDIDPNLGRQDGLPLSMLRFKGRDTQHVKSATLPLILAEIRSLISTDSTLIIGVNDGSILNWTSTQTDQIE
ncbi:MAG: VCBS repeat-containing protein [Saprospiraceae bacterium]|nr:VCBS repeat-containing protein [Saprospiraceae bacterium]